MRASPRKISVKLFAAARELAGQEQVEVELASPANISQLREVILAEYPALGPLLPYALFAINANYATDKTVVPTDAEVACIPPVSGG